MKVHLRVNPSPQRNPQRKRENDAGGRDGKSGARGACEMAEIEFRADQKHNEDQSNLADNAQMAACGRIEYYPLSMWPQCSENRWAQDQTGGNLSTYLRLAKTFEQSTESPRGANDENEFDENLHGSDAERSIFQVVLRQ